MERYENLSVWRVVACAGVFISHLCARAGLRGSMRVVTDFGYYGVLFFFIITGYLACDSKIIRSSKIQYWKKRLVRILPLYLTVMLFFFIAYSISEKGMKNGWSLLTSSNNTGGTWTIHVFMLFYLLAPWLVKLVDTYYKSWLCVIFLYGLRFIIKTYGLQGLCQPVSFLCFCAEGILLWHCFHANESRTVFIVSLLITVLLIQGTTDSYFLYSLTFMLFFISRRKLHIQNEALRRMIVFIDKYTYAIYMMQGIVFYLLIDRRNPGKLETLILSLTGMIIFVPIAYYGIEVSARRMLTRQKQDEEIKLTVQTIR